MEQGSDCQSNFGLFIKKYIFKVQIFFSPLPLEKERGDAEAGVSLKNIRFKICVKELLLFKKCKNVKNLPDL
jgi:hypothetical protein